MLTDLHLIDFKSFVKDSVELSKMTLLIGANASGKSNILDAIRFLQGVALDMPLIDILRGHWEGGRLVWPGLRGGFSDIMRKGETSFYIASDWRLGEGNETRFLRHSIMVDAGQYPQLSHEAIREGDGYLFDTHAPSLGYKQGRDTGSSIHVALKRAGRGNSPTQTHSANRGLLFQVDLSKPVAPAVRTARDAIANSMRSAYFLDITPSRMRDYSPKHMTSVGLEGENVSAVAWQLCQDPETRRDLVDWLTELCAPELVDIDFSETDLGDVMLVLVEEGDRRIPARSLSDGTLRFLGQLIALRTAPPGSLLLIEEVENGLHPTRAHLLVEAMEAATTERGVQVIATTHSPIVLNALSPEALRQAILVARPPGADGSVLRKLGDLPDFDAVCERRGVDRMLTSGWLERAV